MGVCPRMEGQNAKRILVKPICKANQADFCEKKIAVDNSKPNFGQVPLKFQA